VPAELDLLRGTLDLFVLKALTWGPMHGLAIVRWIESVTDDGLQVEEGALYPALHRMEQREWIAGEWGTSETNRRARFYRMTPAGRRAYAAQLDAWKRYTTAADLILSARGAA
jgi:transcriptional regulator